MQTDFESKYKALKLKLKDMVDLAFRLGVQEGLRQSEVQQMQQAQQSAMAPQPGEEGQPGQPGSPDEGQAEQAGDQTSSGSELDSHISELESMLHKTDVKSADYAILSKSLAGFKAHQSELKRKAAQKMILDIGKSMKKPFAIGAKAQKNMSEPAKKSLSMQEELVKNLMDGWAKEEDQLKNKVNQTLGIEGFLKS